MPARSRTGQRALSFCVVPDRIRSPMVAFPANANPVAASGSAAAPSYSFTSVTTGGVYAPAANSVGISTSSTLRFIVSAASYIRASLPFVLTAGALGLGGTLVVGGGTTTNIVTTDSSRIVVDTVVGGEGRAPPRQVASSELRIARRHGYERAGWGRGHRAGQCGIYHANVDGQRSARLQG